MDHLAQELADIDRSYVSSSSSDFSLEDKD
jgi:hypothetical protein